MKNSRVHSLTRNKSHALVAPCFGLKLQNKVDFVTTTEVPVILNKWCSYVANKT